MWIRGSGFGSKPKCHGSATRFKSYRLYKFSVTEERERRAFKRKCRLENVGAYECEVTLGGRDVYVGEASNKNDAKLAAAELAFQARPVDNSSNKIWPSICGSASLWCGSGFDLLPRCRCGCGSGFGFLFDADADPTFYPDADPGPDADPCFQVKAQTLEKVLKYIFACNLQIDAYPDLVPNPAYHFHTAPDSDADLDQDF
jgi:hypothetical protein